MTTIAVVLDRRLTRVLRNDLLKRSWQSIETWSISVALIFISFVCKRILIFVDSSDVWHNELSHSTGRDRIVV